MFMLLAFCRSRGAEKITKILFIEASSFQVILANFQLYLLNLHLLSKTFLSHMLSLGLKKQWKNREKSLDVEEECYHRQ